ncbi:hypothetical protein KC19_VG107600 [Ceratodon purpureus]|uniref:Uncharacterized protein n=1 Tax=Ceratodon purpureus TaxID=3225 RepID=A0A8T0HNY6_CERPU|nr:hypothetical protein KC19_VG107600 [Ceratodon purpureus]
MLISRGSDVREDNKYSGTNDEEMGNDDNEYERLRTETIARNQAFLNPALQDANALCATTSILAADTV